MGRTPAGQALFARALAAHRDGRLAEAEPLYRELIAADPGHHQAANNLGCVLQAGGRIEEAAAVFATAEALGREAHAPRLGLAQCLMTLGRYVEAEAVLRRGLTDRPGDEGLQLALGRVLLALGRYAEGWPLYDALRPDPGKAFAARLPIPEWRGEPLAGKRLLIWREQGFGDQIMLARFIPQLAGAEITYAGRPELERLFRHLPMTYASGPLDVSAAAFDGWTLPMSLPGRLQATLETLPAPPYLSGVPTRSGGVGVVWRGNATPDPGRSLSPEAGAALLALPGAISLDPADTGARDFQDTADLIAGLDIVVSIDTSVAHLAGAMGKPLWLLLPARDVAWRWEPRRTTTPWYPTARLYRQARPGDWAPVVETVRRDLAGR